MRRSHCTGKQHINREYTSVQNVHQGPTPTLSKASQTSLFGKSNTSLSLGLLRIWHKSDSVAQLRVAHNCNHEGKEIGMQMQNRTTKQEERGRFQPCRERESIMGGRM